jgi:predicted enzyme related to lactoylglutathione lyase
MIQDRYPHGAPCWVEIVAPDQAATEDFYAGLFGWRFGDGVARLDGRVVAGVGAPGRPGWRTYMRVRHAAGVAAGVVEGGGWVLPGGLFTDPDGAVFGVTDVGRAAELVNVPGSWNWSNLHTPAPAGASEFYAPLFGWVTSSVHDAVMVRLPGYSDVLELNDPGIRVRHAANGAPEGFRDAVAWITPTTGRARWDVTFAVADADAVASRAEALGGEITTEPFDGAGARIAALRDPQGSAFTVSAWSG